MSQTDNCQRGRARRQCQPPQGSSYLRVYWKLGVKPIEQPIIAGQQVDTCREKLTIILKGLGGCPKINRQV